MSDLLSMSLDQIIDQKKQIRKDAKKQSLPARNGSNNGPSAAGRGAKQRSGAPYIRPNNAGSNQQQNTPAAVAIEQNKILVNNLAFSVTQKDLTDLFSRIGQVKHASLNFDEHGKSKGSGTIVFSKSSDAAKAIKEYHDRLFDNRPMKLELVVQASKTTFLNSGQVAIQAAPTIASRLGQQTNGHSSAGGPIRNGAAAGGIKKHNPQQHHRGGARGGRGRGGMRKRSDGGHPKSADQLDAEMDAYMKDSEMKDA